VRELSRGTEREWLFTALKSEVEEDQKVLKELLRGARDSRQACALEWHLR